LGIINKGIIVVSWIVIGDSYWGFFIGESMVIQLVGIHGNPETHQALNRSIKIPPMNPRFSTGVDLRKVFLEAPEDLSAEDVQSHLDALGPFWGETKHRVHMF
jgi:hypothetical protein